MLNKYIADEHTHLCQIRNQHFFILRTHLMLCVTALGPKKRNTASLETQVPMDIKQKMR